jgi:hypothetical protein
MTNKNVFANGVDDELARDWLKSIRKTGTVDVEFKKKDDTMRVMKCTLDPVFLPAVLESAETPARKVSPDTLVVYDLEAKSWRSFRWDSVTSVTFS